MTGTTSFLDLTTYSATTDASALFSAFRTDVAGSVLTSNMNLIDIFAMDANGSIVRSGSRINYNTGSIVAIQTAGSAQDILISWNSGSIATKLSSIAGSAIMTSTTGSVVKHNISGITTGSYNKVIIDTYGHVTTGSQIAYQTVSSIAGSAIMTSTTGSVVKHNISGIVAGSYIKVIVDSYGHVTTGSITFGDASFITSTKTGSYVLQLSDYVCLASGSITLTLPTAVGCLGKSYILKNISTSEVLINSTSGSIDSGSQASLTTLEYKSFISDNTDWWII